MDEAVLDGAGHEVVFQLLIFRVRNLAVDFRIVGSAATGNVLVHKAEHNLSRLEGAGNPVNDALAVVEHARHNQMADNDALRHDSVITDMVIAYLTIHLLDGLGGRAEVAGSIAVFYGGDIVAVFQIRQINLHLALEAAQRILRFKAAGVVDNGDGQGLVKAFEHSFSEVRGRDEVDIVRTLGDELMIDFL